MKKLKQKFIRSEIETFKHEWVRIFSGFDRAQWKCETVFEMDYVLLPAFLCAERK